MTILDDAASDFTRAMARATNWKFVYVGAAESTRLRKAIEEVRNAADALEQKLDREDERRRREANWPSKIEKGERSIAARDPA